MFLTSMSVCHPAEFEKFWLRIQSLRKKSTRTAHGLELSFGPSPPGKSPRRGWGDLANCALPTRLQLLQHLVLIACYPPNGMKQLTFICREVDPRSNVRDERWTRASVWKEFGMRLTFIVWTASTASTRSVWGSHILSGSGLMWLQWNE